MRLLNECYKHTHGRRNVVWFVALLQDVMFFGCVVRILFRYNLIVKLTVYDLASFATVTTHGHWWYQLVPKIIISKHILILTFFI